MSDELKLSKKKPGRFPTDEEVKALAEEVEGLPTSALRQ